MQLNQTSIRYAKALLHFAIQNNALDTVHSDVLTLQSAIKGSPDLALCIKSAAIQEGKKIRIYKMLFEGKISNITLNFFLLIAKKSRSKLIPFILNAFIVQYKAYKNIVSVDITTAVIIDESIHNQLADILKKEDPEMTVEIKASVNSNLIGGFIFRTDTHQIDASVAHRLNTLKRELLNTSYTRKL